MISILEAFILSMVARYFYRRRTDGDVEAGEEGDTVECPGSSADKPLINSQHGQAENPDTFEKTHLALTEDINFNQTTPQKKPKSKKSKRKDKAGHCEEERGVGLSVDRGDVDGRGGVEQAGHGDIMVGRQESASHPKQVVILDPKHTTTEV